MVETGSGSDSYLVQDYKREAEEPALPEPQHLDCYSLDLAPEHGQLLWLEMPYEAERKLYYVCKTEGNIVPGTGSVLKPGAQAWICDFKIDNYKVVPEVSTKKQVPVADLY